MKRFSLFLLFFSLFFSSSYGFDSEQRYTIETKIGASKQDVHFRTPGANSILDWSTDTVDYGIDLKVKLIDNFFTNFEYTYSDVKAGNSTDDDVENGFDAFSWHGVHGRINDFKLTFGYRQKIDEKFTITPLVGGFYKEAKVSTENGFGIYEGVFVDFSGVSPGNQTNSKYSGIMLGFDNEYKISNRSKISLRLDYLLPFSYQADNIWYGRDPDLHWTLENSDDTGAGDNGLRVLGNLTIKAADSFIKNVKFYAYYEIISFSGLIESEGQGSTNPFSIDGTNCSNCLSEGKAKFEAFGGGLSLQF